MSTPKLKGQPLKILVLSFGMFNTTCCFSDTKSRKPHFIPLQCTAPQSIAFTPQQSETSSRLEVSEVIPTADDAVIKKADW